MWEAKTKKVKGIKWYYWSVIEEGLPGRTCSDSVAEDPRKNKQCLKEVEGHYFNYTSGLWTPGIIPKLE